MNDPSTSSPTTQQTEAIHAAYCALVGPLMLTIDRYYWWGQWLARGWTSNDLELVIRHLQAEIKVGRRRSGCLKWSNLIQQPERFEEELIQAKAHKRNQRPAPSPRDQALSQLRPAASEPVPAAPEAKPISYWIEQMRSAVK